MQRRAVVDTNGLFELANRAVCSVERKPRRFDAGPTERKLINSSRQPLSALLLCGLLFLIPNAPANAGSATWKPNPTSGDWNTAANWTPATVPNGPDDVATFAQSNVKAISLPSLSATILDGLVFEAVASDFTTTIAPDASLVFSGSGVTNNSTKTQYFVIEGGVGAGAGSINFLTTPEAELTRFTLFTMGFRSHL